MLTENSHKFDNHFKHVVRNLGLYESIYGVFTGTYWEQGDECEEMCPGDQKPKVYNENIKGCVCSVCAEKTWSQFNLCRRKCSHGDSICAQCFPSDASISVLEVFKGRKEAQTRVKRMSELRVGDRVLSQNGYSKVFAFMDDANNVLDVSYVQLATAAGASLTLTPDHMLYAHDDRRPVLAETVVKGDKIWMQVSSNATTIEYPTFVASTVVSVSTVVKQGMHAPLTVEGSIVVDGVLASSYAKVHSVTWGENYVLFHGHDINMQMHAPLRLACSAMPSLCGKHWHSSEGGRHAWTQMLLSKFSWLQAMNLQHHDLRSALVEEPTLYSCTAAVVQILAAVILSALFGPHNTVLFTGMLMAVTVPRAFKRV
jgi:hypothetical protein